MKPWWTNGVSTLYRADAREIPLPDASVHCAVTSPPYWGLRDYGLGQWTGGDSECGHERQESKADNVYYESVKQTIPGGWRQNKGEMPPMGICHCGAIQQAAGIGLEPTLGEWVQNVVAVMREVRRVLRDDGTCWLNLGDAYSSNPSNGRGGGSTLGGGSPHLSGSNRDGSGLPLKNLMGQPWRVAFALQDDGWILRSAPVWHKPNPMPESATDRPTSSYEMVFLLAKSGSPTFWTHQDGYGSRTKPAPDYRMVNGKQMNMWRAHDYFYDAEAVREPYAKSSVRDKRDNVNGHRRERDFTGAVDNGGTNLGGNRHGGANLRNVWTIATQPRKDAHFATFPDALPRRCILAGTSAKGVCGECGAPWARVVERIDKGYDGSKYGERAVEVSTATGGTAKSTLGSSNGKLTGGRETLGWQPTCGCNAAVMPATVLDPFVGSGTTVAVAQGLGRRGVGLDLNEEYLGIAAKRIGVVSLPLLEVASEATP